MPLLNKKPLERIPLPQNLSPNDPVYYCEATDEIFCTYDDFFDRLMELNSTVWTCEFTNRSGLTYFEAQESEQEALKALESFPESLEVPILWLVQNASCRGRFEDLLNDIYAFLKDRYFIGEEVVIGDGSARKVASIVSLTCIRDDWEPDDSKSKEVQTPPVDWYNYTARVQGGPYEEDYEIDNLVFVMLSRNKRIVARSNLKLFLKNTCFVKNNERYEVKDRFRELHQLDDRKWTDFFGGPEAVFPRTPMLARGRAAAKAKIDVTGDYLKFEDDEFGGQAAPLCTFVPKTPKAPRTPKPRGRPPKTPKDGTPKTPSARDISASPTKKKALSEKRKAEILAQQTELFVTFEKARRIGIENVGYWQQEDRLLTKREIDQLNELLKEARKKEREAHQKKKEAAQNWARKRDDLECDDLQRMPDYPAVPLPDWLSPDQFAEVLDVLQFFNSFSELLPVKELRGTTRVSLSDIVIAIRCSDPNNSSFASLMQILLQARADVCDEEEGDEADFSRRDELVLEQNPDYEHPEHGEAVREMTALHEEIRYTLGSAVRNLSCDWLTITEVLRLMILTSGYVTRPAKHRHRLFQRGSIRFYEDPAYLFRIGNPELVEKLAVGTVFDLQPAERLQLMHVIMQQLLTYAKFRNFAAERAEDLVTQRKELKKLRCWDTSQESDAKEARLLREMESDGTADVPERPKPTKETIKLKGLLKAAQEGKRHDQGELQRILLEGVVWNELELEEIVFAREMQKRHVQEGMDQLRSGIFELTTVYGSSSLGRDRAFRNYIIVDQVPILLVENPQELDRIGSCIEQTECKDRGDLESEDSWRDSVLACSGNVGTCIVHGLRAQQRTRWCYIESPEQLEQVLSCCNPRGFREIDLSSEIDYLKPEIVELLDKTYNKSRNGSLSQYFMERADDPALLDNKMDWLHEVIELILELESKMTEGFLGRLPSNINRDEWRKMLGTTGDVTPLIQDDITCDIKQREVLHSKDDFHKLTPIEKVGIAFLQVVQAVNVKFIKKPFTRVGPGSVIEPTWTLIHWQRSVVKCRSVPSLALHLYSIEPAIQWEKSKLQAKCRVCRKKGDADNLVLCTECEKCYHLGCAKPRLTEVVSPWTCHDCRKEDEKEEKLNGQANGDVSMDIEANNENESNNSSDKSKEDILRTSSGRKVKRAEYNIDRLTSLAPPPKKKVAVDREVSVANSTFSNGKEGSHNGEVTADEDEEAITSRSEENGDYDYSDSESTPRAVKRRSVLNRSALETSATSGRLSIGLRDADPNFKEKMKKLHDVVKSATRQEFAWPFLAPVDVNEVPDYLEIIKRPMDLGTMINKFSNHFYDNADQVRKDADLIVSNCKTYNEEDSEIYECAMQLADYWENNLNPVFKTENGRKRRR